MSTEPEHKRMDPLQHVLNNPERDLGRCDIYETHRWLYNPMDGSMERKKIPYSSALERIFLEILYNACDNAQRSIDANIDPGTIHVWMNKTSIRVKNHGRPISCGIQPDTDGMHIPEFIFGNLLTSSNYDKSKARRFSGKYGLGCKLTNILSTSFTVDIVNHNEGVRYVQVWKNNMRDKSKPKITKPKQGEEYKESYTQVTFTPDFSIFYDKDDVYGYAGQREFVDNMFPAFAKHCVDGSLTSGLKVYFNDKEIDCSGKKGIYKYAKLLYPNMENHLLIKQNNSICLLIDTPDNGNILSFVNGIYVPNGGIHVDTWCKILYTPIQKVLKNKYKGLSVGVASICKHISMILVCRLDNPEYDGQTKETIIKPKPEVASSLSSHAATIMKWSGIDRLKEQLRMELASKSKKTNGKKCIVAKSKKLIDARYAGDPKYSRLCTLYITEGDSASNFVVKGIQDGYYAGVMPIRGKLLNVGTCDIEQYNNNEEIANIKDALGLQDGTNYAVDNNIDKLRYGKLIIASDQDVDGMHIRGLVMNFFIKKFPELLHMGFVQIMETPLLKLNYKGDVIPFYYQKEYDRWCDSPDKKGYQPSYYKGLGSSSDHEILEAFKIHKVVEFKMDEKSEDMISMAFDKGNESKRKEWMMSWLPSEGKSLYSDLFPEDTMSHFISNQLCEYAYKTGSRAIPKISDGLKECQRKILYTIMGINGKKKVSQLEGTILDKTDYNHGPTSLYHAIVCLGNYCVGTNNIPLIKGEGQYDSRLGRGTAGEDRYIYASKSPILKYIFREEDECILEYEKDGNKSLEPVTYYPILPLFALNGCTGIGTGFSTKIPAHNPEDLIRYIIWWLEVKVGKIKPEEADSKRPLLTPWYRNYQGKIERKDNVWYSIGSYEVIKSKKHIPDIMITEIPVTHTIETYKKVLDYLEKTPIMDELEYRKLHPDGKDKCPTYIKAYKVIPCNYTYTYKGVQYIEVLPRIMVIGAQCLGKDPLKTLGLIRSISDTNITLLDKDNRPKQYGSKNKRDGIIHAIDAYCEIRYNAYIKRKKTLMKQWKDEIKQLEMKKLFIQDVINGKIQLKDERGKPKKKNILVEEIKPYPEIFLKMNLHTLTEDGVAKINTAIAKLQEKYDNYKNTSISKMWFTELMELSKHI